MREPLKEAHAAPAQEPAVESVAERVDVEQRQREQQAVGSADLPTGQKGDRIGGEVVVGQDRALGDARGSRRVDDGRGGVAIQAGLGPRRGGVRQFRGLRRGG